ncbi:MAG: Bacteriohemerythrin [Firmicutes bacterium]|nr:Bacteriohemerythrin [candidate division NPL-UPA2 bacterium]
MPIKWNETLAVGITEIDDQHKELFARMNSLLEACNKGKGKEAVLPMIAFLEEYGAEHFRAEEELQKTSGYPQFEKHRELHREFLRNVRMLNAKLEEHGPTLPFVIEVNTTVVNWLTAHISKIDKELGMFLKAKR